MFTLRLREYLAYVSGSTTSCERRIGYGTTLSLSAVESFNHPFAVPYYLNNVRSTMEKRWNIALVATL